MEHINWREIIYAEFLSVMEALEKGWSPCGFFSHNMMDLVCFEQNLSVIKTSSHIAMIHPMISHYEADGNKTGINCNDVKTLQHN